MAFLKVATFLALVVVITGEEFVIEGVRRTNWGTWGAMEICPPGNYVYGMRLKVDERHGTFGDDTALNGIEFLCFGPTGKRPARNASISEFATITSIVGHHGSYGGILECPDPQFAVGFEMRSEGDQGALADDTAANNFRLLCSSLEVLNGHGQDWGDWTGMLNCPRGLKICGIQTQVEGENGDETALNNVNIGCCV